MTDRSARGDLSTEDLAILLEVTRSLAAPFDLMSMLAAVTDAATSGAARRAFVGLAARCGRRRTRARSIERHPARAHSGGPRPRRRVRSRSPGAQRSGLLRRSTLRPASRSPIGLPDPLQPDPAADRSRRRAGRRHAGAQSHRRHLSDAADEQLASALAAQCAVALQRVQMIESLIEGEKMRREMEMAQVVQMSTLPQAMPAVAGYDVHGTFRPAAVDGRRYLRPRAGRRRIARRARRRHRPWHRAGAVGDADARDAAHGVSPRRRPRDRVRASQRPACRDARRGPLRHRLHRRARSACPRAALRQRRPGADPPLPRRSRHVLAPQADELSARRDGAAAAAAGGRDDPCARRRARPAVRRDLRIRQRRGRAVRRRPRRGGRRRPPRARHGGAVGRAARRGAGLRGRCGAGRRHHGRPRQARGAR